ncbi:MULTISPECIES: MarR family winged helix-turn-helix transcriptional regulator [unclassified Pseudomonas]|uniref:MarR family winged helix-turn-helix transcriptional regulator n=1 Tax=unclassified Pseudomonas TaxID=196821 RepID=UPI0017829EE0|nr:MULTISPECIES: MarR family winged helix-turn-helix transcriptional regulator [unclassified Pseudomonas]MBD9562221.1 winged helix-turn-helix transcriptional regulator [Pseudomonas sp. PDM09]MBV7495111.1 MarR family winged helix-turn-helix transcriptional regulator [Pseudomonas sp. PDM24]
MMLDKSNVEYMVTEAARLIRCAFVQQIENRNLTLRQAQVLAYIARHPGCRQADLAEALAKRNMTLTGVLDRLERQGLLERRQDPSDRRAHLLFLKDKASAELDTISSSTTNVREAALQNISEADITVLTNVLRNIAENLNSKTVKQHR